MEHKNNIRYFNTLTTPSGKECKLYEITNKDYLVLLKFLQSENYEYFFKTLDSFIEESIPDLTELNIIDRMYVYIAFCYYNIHPTIPVTHPKIGSTDLELSKILEDIENNYNFDEKIFDITDKIQVKAHYARDFHFENNIPVIDYGTCIKEIKKEKWEKITKENSEQLIETIQTDLAIKIEMFSRKNLSKRINAFNLPMMDPVYVDINSEEIIYLVYSLFKENLQSYYTELYISIHYLKLDKQGFDSLTPVETSIILKAMADDKEKQNKEMKKGSGLSIPSAVNEDSMF